MEGDRGAGGGQGGGRGREAGAEITGKAIVCCLLLGIIQSKTFI